MANTLIVERAMRGYCLWFMSFTLNPLGRVFILINMHNLHWFLLIIYLSKQELWYLDLDPNEEIRVERHGQVVKMVSAPCSWSIIYPYYTFSLLTLVTVLLCRPHLWKAYWWMNDYTRVGHLTLPTYPDGRLSLHWMLWSKTIRKHYYCHRDFIIELPLFWLTLMLHWY